MTHYMQTPAQKCAFLLFAALFVFLFMPVMQAGAVFITPSRVYLDDNQRTARIILKNRGADTRKISFGWDHMIMQEGGALKRLKEGEAYPGYNPIADYITFSPRRVILSPDQSQTIRIMFRKPADLPPGEYRTHFRVLSEPAANQENAEQTQEERMKLGLLFKTAKAIPIIYWAGETKIDVNFVGYERVNLPSGPGVQFELNNNSTRTIYFRILFECPGEDGQPVVISRSSERLYPEASKAYIRESIKQNKLDKCPTVTAKLVGEDDPEYEGKVFAQTTFSVR